MSSRSSRANSRATHSSSSTNPCPAGCSRRNISNTCSRGAGHEFLRRLFHEEGVIVYDEKPVFKQCRCSKDKVQNVIDNLSEEDRDHAAEDGAIEMTCEFCSETYTIKI
ncbi:MAG: hypothetical protein COB76_05595 [Alphaproteobacteria bacterium]|nr:MAG: hypothetical protein COB76_05595 [Alphaproteobacteria bacterium]